jgi:hypothetical protein
VRVAALYDVHGNLPALEAVLAEVPEEATIDVAYGPFPGETLDRLRELGGRAPWLRGNADRWLTRDDDEGAPAELIEWVRERLSEEQIAFLHALPASLELEIDGLGRVSHLHFDRVVNGRRIVNADSVGVTHEDEPGAYWTLVGPGVEVRRTEYDLARVAGTGFPGRIGAERASREEFLADAQTVVVGQ